jgi:hypothetical protein
MTYGLKEVPVEEVIVTLLIIALFAVMTLSAVRYYRRRLRRTLEALQGSLDGKIISSVGGYSLMGRHGEREVKVELRLGSQRSSPSYIYISMKAPALFDFHFLRKGLAVSLGVRLGLIRDAMKEVQGLDGSYLLRSTSEASIRGFLIMDENRELLRSLLSEKFNSIKVENESIQVSRILTGLALLKKELEPSHISSVLERLSELAARLEKFSHGIT